MTARPDRPCRADDVVQATIDALDGNVCVLDEAGVVRHVNRAWRAFAEANGAPGGSDYVGEDYRGACGQVEGPGAAFVAQLRELLEGRRERCSCEYPCHRPGSERWFVARGAVLQLEGERRVLVTHTDVTERVLADRARAREARLVDALRGSSLGIWDWALAGDRFVIDECSRALLGLGPGRDEVAVDEWESLIHADDLAGVRELLATHLAGATEAWVAEYRLARPEGGWRWVLVTGAVATREADGTPRRVAGTIRDITERRRLAEAHEALQQKAARAERLAGLGTLAAGMAHEINNPLACVLSGLGFLEEQLQNFRGGCVEGRRACEDGRLRELEEVIAEAGEGARRVRDLVAELRAFASSPATTSSRSELQSVLARATRLARHALEGVAKLELALPPLPEVVGGEAELVQLFACLLVNAGQARGDGPLAISVTAACEGARVVVRVVDTGRGIPAEAMPRLFDPFFTTREVGQGKGLGLPAALGIARGLGGSLELESVPGVGTAAIVTLPVAGTATG